MVLELGFQVVLRLGSSKNKMVPYDDHSKKLSVAKDMGVSSNNNRTADTSLGIVDDTSIRLPLTDRESSL